MQFEKRLAKYVRKKAEKKWVLNQNPPKDYYQTFIVIPAKAESDDLPHLLKSISKQDKKNLKQCLVVIVFNRSDEDSYDIYNNNVESINYINTSSFNFDICYVDANSKQTLLPKKHAGVGLARKIGVDLILQYALEDSIICYTDADTILSGNYLKIIKKYYNKNNCGCAILSFQHQKSTDSIIEKNIRLYEKFLSKTAQDLKRAGSPYGYISLGSAMTCTTSAYIAVGGMNRLKATEDFYFLQELTKHFGYMNCIKDIIVFPSSRISSRVYLGTGHRMQEIQKGNTINELYFSDTAFINLKKFLKIIENSYPLNIKELLQETSHISELNDFLISNEIEKIWDSLIKNVDYNKYIAQFHRWFDGLKTIKFLKYFSN